MHALPEGALKHVASDKARAAFSPILANPIVGAAQADGTRIVTMSHLDDAEALDAIRALRRDGASAAAADPALPIG
jgi:hypothetical protein